MRTTSDDAKKQKIEEAHSEICELFTKKLKELSSNIDVSMDHADMYAFSKGIISYIDFEVLQYLVQSNVVATIGAIKRHSEETNVRQ